MGLWILLIDMKDNFFLIGGINMVVVVLMLDGFLVLRRLYRGLAFKNLNRIIWF